MSAQAQPQHQSPSRSTAYQKYPIPSHSAVTDISNPSSPVDHPTPFRFSRLDITQGLSNNQVLSIYRDPLGYVWFGTGSGLDRYDGHGLKIFRHDARDSTSLPDDCINQIFQGPDTRLWISTRAGFCIYDPQTERFDRNPTRWLRQAGIDADSIVDLRKDGAGAYWFLIAGKEGGLYKYPTQSGSESETTRGRAPEPNGARGNHHDNTSVPAVIKAIRIFPQPTRPAPRENPQPDSASSQRSHSLTTTLYSARMHGPLPTAFAPDGTSGFWLVFPDGMLQDIDAASGQVITTSSLVRDLLPKKSMNYRIYVDADRDCWVYTIDGPRGLMLASPAKNTIHHFTKDPHGLNTNLVTGVLQDDKGLIWVATDHGGVNILNKKDLSVQWLLSNDDDDNSISQNCINTLVKDSTGIVWIGTYKRGVSFYHEDNLKFPLFRHHAGDPNSLPYDDVNRFVEDEKGDCWIGTNGGGLICFNRQTGHWTRFQHDPSKPNSLSNDVIVSLCMDRHHRLWIGTYFGGLDCFDGKSFTHYRHSDTDPNSLADDRVWEAMEDHQGRLWIGTLAAGLDCFDTEQHRFIHYRPGNNDRTVHATYISELRQDSKGLIWVGTDNGIDVLDPVSGIFRHYGHDPADPASLSNNYVMTIVEDSRGFVWIGTRAGLNLYDRNTNRFTSFHREDGLPDNSILTILEDNAHHLWLGTPNGLSNMWLHTDPQTGSIRPHFRNYDESYGLQGREFNENAALKTRGGEMIFGGAGGFNLFQPADLHCHDLTPRLVLTDLQVFNKNIGIGDTINGHVLLPQALTDINEIKLRYNESIFSIGFTALDFLHEQKLKYAYKLAGFNQDWLISEGPTHRAVFTNLDPGHYTLLVRTGTDDGVWDTKPIQLSIVIMPPFWKTPLAYFSYAVLFLFFLLAARHLLLRRAHMRFALQQERKEAQRLHELDMMKIKFFTNVSHEFRTPLSLILTPLDKIIRNTEDPGRKAQLGLVHRNARRLLNMVNQLLDFRKLEVQELRLNKTEGDIVHFIRECSFSFTDIAEKKNATLSFETGIATLRTSFDHDKLERILFNLLSNAFKFTPEYGQVKVSVDLLPAPQNGQPPLLSLEVADTGIGIAKDRHEKIFERFFQNDTPGSIVNQGSGIGLSITREFVRLHNGAIQVESEPDHGSRFTVLLPLYSPVLAEQAAPNGPSSVSLVGPGVPASSEGSTSSVGSNSSVGSALPVTSSSSDPSTSSVASVSSGSSHPSHPSAPSHLSVPSHQSVPSHPSIPPHPSAPSNSSVPSHPSNPSVSPINAIPPVPGSPVAPITGQPHSSSYEQPPHADRAARLPVVLLVEDNEDFRFYLKDNLREFFTILEAADGAAGWQKALGGHPDLVVSDISMPQMNGIDLCQKIRNDSRTANIPVILLTALAGEDQQLKGLETGASDYMTKPFNFEILLSKIRNLLSQQEQARKTFSRQVQAAPTAARQLSPDEQFIRKALEMVEHNMSNPDFSVEEMSRGLFCSRVGLYKKLLHLTGKTPIEFIRSIRLKRAAQLLEKERFTVAEIAYEVGFNNPKNFSRYFKMEYGVLPSVYQRNALTSDTPKP